MVQIYVIGVGLEGPSSLSASTLAVIAKADVLVASKRLIQSFTARKLWELQDFTLTLQKVATYAQDYPHHLIVILTTGDPLFFGLGRLIVNFFSPEQLQFIPAVSSIQLAFNRLKLPWQDAALISVHGREFDHLIDAVRKGRQTIAVLTDPTHSPAAIARLILALDLPIQYQGWVCENLGASSERVELFDLENLQHESCASLTILILIRQEQELICPGDLPAIGISDSLFHTFCDRPGLMTKREVRMLALGELALQKHHICWDIGAGTGAISIEMARLLTDGAVYAVEKSAAGAQLVEKNRHRFGISNLHITQGLAPEMIQNWPCPDRIFIGGSGAKLVDILQFCQLRLRVSGKIVLAVATLENLSQSFDFLRKNHWRVSILQVQISKSVPIAQLTRFQPLNPTLIITACRT